MRILIRNVRRTGSEGIESSEKPFDGDVVSIGRATDQIIQLKSRTLPLSHSELRDAGSSLTLRATGEDFFFVNGKRSRSSRLAIGDEVEIGEYTLTPREAPSGYDYALDVEVGEISESEVGFGTNFAQGLEQTALSKRGVSWALFVLVLGFFLAIPAVGMFDRDVGIALRNIPIVDDGVWDSGPLHPSHQLIGDDCTACHVDAFTMVRDEQCVVCHQATTHHVDVAVHDVPELEGTRCASCHKEHNEPTVLSRADQDLCADCHADLQAWTNGVVAVEDVADFEYDHPEFKLSMLVGDGVGDAWDWRVERVALDEPGLVETSNLIFPHDVHMDAGGVEGPAGEVVMACGDCHEPEAGGAYMKPVRMEQHCADCHLLTFDTEFPDRELPHGEPDQIVRLLEEFYARQVLLGIAEVVPASASNTRVLRPARRPGGAIAQRREERVAPQPELPQISEALAKADRAASDVFERTSCKICHEVDVIDDPERASRWQVRPVRIAQVWMPKSWFDHGPHQLDDCARCHAAEGSSLASDVNMPAVESCRDCHGGGTATNKLASGCVECHQFHIPTLDPMRPDLPGVRSLNVASDLDRMRGQRVDARNPMRTN